MEPVDLLKHLASTLDALAIPYLITGSVATVVYGEPRFTLDVDVVVAMTEAQVAGFCAAFPSPDFWQPAPR